MNLPQDTIIKVGRGGVSNQGNKKGENRTYFNQEARKLSKTTHNKTTTLPNTTNKYFTKEKKNTQKKTCR